MEGKEGTRGERGRDTSVSPEGLKWKKRERERNGRMEEEGKRKGMERECSLLQTHFLLPRTVENTLCSRLTEWKASSMYRLDARSVAEKTYGQG